jgi:hypothetical protein
VRYGTEQSDNTPFDLPREGRSNKINILNIVVTETMLLSANKFRLKQGFEIRQSRAAQKGSIWNATKQRHSPILLQRFGHILLCLVILVAHDLVDDNTSNPDSVFLTEAPIQLKLVKRRA